MVKNLTLSEINYDAFEDMPVFNKATLATIIDKRGEALNYWVKRLIKTGEVIPLKRDLFVSRSYLLKVKGQPLLFDQYRELLSSSLRAPSYISLEYVLAKYGIIVDVPFAITAITSKSSRTFTNEFGTFVFRNIKRPVFCGYKETFFRDKRYYIATPAKALFDFVYLRKFEQNSMEWELEEGLRINWKAFTAGDLKELASFVNLSGKKKMKTFLDIIIGRKFI